MGTKFLLNHCPQFPSHFLIVGHQLEHLVLGTSHFFFPLHWPTSLKVTLNCVLPIMFYDFRLLKVMIMESKETIFWFNGNQTRMPSGVALDRIVLNKSN